MTRCRRTLTRRFRREVPHPDTAEVPPPATVAAQRNNGHAPNGNRRPVAVTRQLALDLLDAEPSITRKEIASRLGVSTRRLREVLASVP